MSRVLNKDQVIYIYPKKILLHVTNSMISWLIHQAHNFHIYDLRSDFGI